MVLQVEMKLEVMTTSSMVPFLISGKKGSHLQLFLHDAAQASVQSVGLKSPGKAGAGEAHRCCMGLSSAT